MAHDIETMMYVGATPWHGLGEYVGDENLNSEEALRLSGLDWQVSKQPLIADIEDGPLVDVPNHFANVRSTDDRVLGVVGNQYQPLQNADAFAFGDALVAEGDLKWHTAGSLRCGQRVWMLGKYGNTEVVPGDVVDNYLLIYNTHDGSGAFRCLFTDVRVVCANTAALALSNGKGQGVSLRHTKTLMDRTRQAADILGLALRAKAKSLDFYQALAERKLLAKDWEALLDAVVPLPEDKRTTRAENQREVLTGLFEGGIGMDIPGVRGTGWGAFNAVTEYTNFHRQTRGGQERRFESALFGSGNALVKTATKHLAELVMA